MGTVAMLVGLRPGQISRLKKRGWMAADYSCRLRTVPTDFVIQHAHMTFGELAVHYGAGNRTVARWVRQASGRSPIKPGRQAQ